MTTSDPIRDPVDFDLAPRPPGDPAAVHRLLAEAWEPVCRFAAAWAEQVTAALRELGRVWGPLAAQLHEREARRRRRARVLGRWSDPEGRWAVWDRKAHRTAVAWSTRSRP